MILITRALLASAEPAYRARKAASQKRGWAEARGLESADLATPPGKLLLRLFPLLRNEVVVPGWQRVSMCTLRA